MENKQKHLEFIQSTVSRMSNNSFLLKGWAVTLVAALFALGSKDANGDYIFIAYFPVIIFAILDGYYLSQERLFRTLYNYVRGLDEGKIDFSMDTRRFEKSENSWLGSIFSGTILCFYLPLAVIMLIVRYFIS